jgi:hypothetical protein
MDVDIVRERLQVLHLVPGGREQDGVVAVRAG